MAYYLMLLLTGVERASVDEDVRESAQPGPSHCRDVDTVRPPRRQRRYPDACRLRAVHINTSDRVLIIHSDVTPAGP